MDKEGSRFTPSEEEEISELAKRFASLGTEAVDDLVLMKLALQKGRIDYL